MSFDGNVEVCHIETPAGKKERLDRGRKRSKKSTQIKTNPRNADTDSIANEGHDELESEDEDDGTQETLTSKKRKSQTDNDGCRPQKKGRAE